MPDILVSLSAATICFLGHCHPALTGAATPVGQYTIVWRQVVSPGYGGDVLEFAEDNEGVFAVHRVFTLLPKQQRVRRLTEGGAAARRGVTGGCINVMPEVYQELVDCCSHGVLRIEP